MCGIYHSTSRPRSGWKKSKHVWEKPLSICIFTKWQKPNICGFFQTLTKYKVCGKKTHMFVKKNMCVFFHTDGALVFEFLIFDINTLYLFLSFQRRTCNIRRQEHLQNSLQKNHLFGNFHTCVEKPKHIKNKNGKNNIKTNKFFMWAPPQLKGSL